MFTFGFGSHSNPVCHNNSYMYRQAAVQWVDNFDDWCQHMFTHACSKTRFNAKKLLRWARLLLNFFIIFGNNTLFSTIKHWTNKHSNTMKVFLKKHTNENKPCLSLNTLESKIYFLNITYSSKRLSLQAICKICILITFYLVSIQLCI